MKITVKRSSDSGPSRFNVEEFNRKAQQIFIKEVKPQIEVAKKTKLPKDNKSCNGLI